MEQAIFARVGKPVYWIEAVRKKEFLSILGKTYRFGPALPV